MKACLEKIKTIDQFDEQGQGVEAMRAAVKELKGFCAAGKAAGCATCAATRRCCGRSNLSARTP